MSSTAKVIRREWLDWPFFEPRHHAVGEALDRFVQSGALDTIDHTDVDVACRKLVRAMGEAGVLDCAVAAPDGDATTIDSRSICLSRESLAYADGLADFAFAMQGLGSGAIALGGSGGPAQGRAAESSRRRMAGGLRAVREGGRIGRRGDVLHGAGRRQ